MTQDVSPQGQVLQQGTLRTRKGTMWTTGQAVLTTQSFSRRVKGTPILYNYFGLLGALINNLFPTRTDIDIQLTSITEIGRGKWGLSKDVLYIGTMDGKSYNLAPNYDIWITALKEALQNQGATLVQSANERWNVQR